jgi:SWI/SNF-related matrix-associated actin-dependent regulator 1 of chromatin subfamily A
VREFERFSPDIDVVAYYGTQAERAGLRADIRDAFKRNKLEVVLASYTQVGSNDDLSFFRKKIEFQVGTVREFRPPASAEKC